MDYRLIILAVVLPLAAAILLEAWLKRGKKPRPLAERMQDGTTADQSSNIPLGMEATDIESVEHAQRLSEAASQKNHDVKFR